MDTKSPRPKRQDNILSLLNVAIDAVDLAEKLTSATPAKAVFGSVSALLTMIRDSMANKIEYVELGLTCANVCKALHRGLGGKKLEDLSPSARDAIEELRTTIAEIQERVLEKGERSLFSRVVHAKDDKGTIAAWKLDLFGILQIFTAELVVNTHTMVSDLHRNALMIQGGANSQHNSTPASVLPRDLPYPTLKPTLRLQPHVPDLEGIAPPRTAFPLNLRLDSILGIEHFSPRERLVDARPITSWSDHTTPMSAGSRFVGESPVQTTNRTSRPSNEHVATPLTRIATPAQQEPHQQSLRELLRPNLPASGWVAEPPAWVATPGLQDPLPRAPRELLGQNPPTRERIAAALAQITKPGPHDLLQRPSSEILRQSPPINKRLAEQLARIARPGLHDLLQRPFEEILRQDTPASERIAEPLIATPVQQDQHQRSLRELFRPNLPASERIAEPLIATHIQQDRHQRSLRELLRLGPLAGERVAEPLHWDITTPDQQDPRQRPLGEILRLNPLASEPIAEPLTGIAAPGQQDPRQLSLKELLRQGPRHCGE